MSGGLVWRRIGLSLWTSMRATSRRVDCLKTHAWEWRDPLSWPQWLRNAVVVAPAVAVLILGSVLVAAQQIPLWRLSAQSAQLALQRKAEVQRSYRRYLELSQAAPHSEHAWDPALATPAKPLDVVAALAHSSAVDIRQAEVLEESGNRTLTLIVEGELAALAQWLLSPSELGAWYTTDYRIEAHQNGRFLLHLTIRWDLPVFNTDIASEALGVSAVAQTSRAERIIAQLTGNTEVAAQPPETIVKPNGGITSEPAASLQFRGLWRSAKGRFALLEAGDGHVYRVQPGDRVGIETANVSAISAEGVTLTLGAVDQPREQILLTPASQGISP